MNEPNISGLFAFPSSPSTDPKKIIKKKIERVNLLLGSSRFLAMELGLGRFTIIFGDLMHAKSESEPVYRNDIEGIDRDS